MKKLRYIIIFFVVVTFFSCNDDEKITLNPNNFKPASEIMGFKEIKEFSKEVKDSKIVISFKAADFGTDLKINYRLQLDVKGNEFKNSEIFNVASDGQKIEFEVGVLNEFLQEKLGLQVDKLSNVEARVIAYVHTAVDTISSSVVSFDISPYLDVLFAEKTLYLFGDAVGKPAQNNKLPLIQVNSHTGLSWRIIWLDATETFKFCSDQTFKGVIGKSGEFTNEEYIFGDDEISVPGESGYYMVVVDIDKGKISITKPKVYLMGDIVGGWSTAVEENVFTVEENELVITKDLAAGELRIYAWHKYFTDWWQSEFVIASKKIEFRADGNDQDRVKVVAGSTTIKLNFKDNSGSVTVN